MASQSGIEQYYAMLVRLVANQMVDPHRYFEQKLVGEMQAEEEAAARRARLLQLLEWLDDGLLTPAQREQVAARLVEAGLPSTLVVGRSSEELGRLDAGH